MARRPIWIVAVLVLASGVAFATPPSEAKATGDALPSPNQSLSIEEVAEPAGQIVESAEPEPLGEPVAGGDVAKAASPAVVAPASGRPPTFLGRKRIVDEAAASAAGAAQAPWYRTSFGALALVLGLMALLYFGLRRWAPSIKVQDAGLVRVMGRTVVGPRQSLLLVSVGHRVVLVGVSPDRIDRVCEISDADEVAAMTAQGQPRGQFSAWLDREAAAYVESDKTMANEAGAADKRPGSKSLSELLQKLRTTRV